MNIAVVTGASSGIGISIVKLLVEMGYTVYGLARDFSKTVYESPAFVKLSCDLSKTGEITAAFKKIKNAEGQVNLLINNAGVGFFGPHEQLSPEQLELMVAVNLTAPLILTGQLLRELKKNSGHVINISSAAARKVSTYGCAYAATKAGLSHFAESLFEEVRKTGLRVTTIQPDMTATDFYKNLDFCCDEAPGSYLETDTVAGLVRQALLMPEGSCITELTVKPRYNRIKRKNPG